jgi:hypothetical protein
MVWDGHGGGAAREEEERGEDEEDVEVDAAQPERQRQGRPRQRVVGAPEHPRLAADVPLYLLLWLPRDGRRPGEQPSVRAHLGGRRRGFIPGEQKRAGVPLAGGWLGFCFDGTSLPRRVGYWAVGSGGGSLQESARRVFIEDPRCRMRARRRGGAETSACCFPGI